MDWFLYDNGLRHERVKYHGAFTLITGIIVHGRIIILWKLELYLQVPALKQ